MSAASHLGSFPAYKLDRQVPESAVAAAVAEVPLQASFAVTLGSYSWHRACFSALLRNTKPTELPFKPARWNILSAMEP